MNEQDRKTLRRSYYIIDSDNYFQSKAKNKLHVMVLLNNTDVVRCKKIPCSQHEEVVIIILTEKQRILYFNCLFFRNDSKDNVIFRYFGNLHNARTCRTC